MKYKVGDRVRILSREALEELAKKEAVTIDPTIYDIAGTIQTIREVFDDDFYFMIDYPLLLSRRTFAETQEEREAVDASETIEQEKINEEMKTFYFVRQPDHMIECSDYFTGCEDVDLIKQKHKIFDTKEEALAYQRVLGIEPEAERKRLNKWFAEEGLAKEFGYERKPRSKEKSSEFPEAVLLNGADVMRALKQVTAIPEEMIEEAYNKRKKRMKEIYKREQWSHEFECPDGYEFRDEKGNVIEAKTIVLEKKKTGYPKSYNECLEILDYHCNWIMSTAKPEDVQKLSIKEMKFKFRLLQFEKLLVCRDAYWKIAGEEMGLGKPWKPKFGGEPYYLIQVAHYEVKADGGLLGLTNCSRNSILAFPTQEIKDAFYKNFKKLIEDCKELL